MMGAMPAPVRTSRKAIVDAASGILEDEGLEALTMAAVAERVGVRGPSLYKHVPNRARLVREVAERVAADLGAAIDAAMASAVDPRAGLKAGAMAQRAFVKDRPNGYGLLFAHLLPESRPDVGLVAAIGLPIVRRMEELVGREQALPAARTLVAWAHGFVSMELAGAFRLGGDVDAAFAFGVDAVIAGCEARSPK
jgi:AcrR family transcriptional regulator